MDVEYDHMVAWANYKDKVDIEILKEKVNKSNFYMCYVAYAESDNDEEKIKKRLSV